MIRALIAACILCSSLTICAQSPDTLLAAKAASIEDTYVMYVPDYVSIDYPMGDVPPQTGVCSDVIIRAFRLIDIDLQKEIHEDMSSNFDEYPNHWGLTKPDKNIDHRRVPNLMRYFDRQGWTLPITDQPTDYQPGDIIAWNLGGGITHIGILVEVRNADGTCMAIHNISGGQVIEDVLFSYKIIGHYRRTL